MEKKREKQCKSKARNVSKLQTKRERRRWRGANTRERIEVEPHAGDAAWLCGVKDQ